MSSFVPGQRWISESQPDMGLGLVLQVEPAAVTVLFAASGETRTYATRNAPLRRVSFGPGDSIELQDGSSLVVEEVVDQDGLIIYRGGAREAAESELGDLMGFHQPDARLLGGRVNSGRKFALRYRALEALGNMRGRRERGLLGARIDLVPHQLYIADEVGTRHAPRVLLADEVGLGKTIEACLIMHRMLLTGRASRVLILVPEPLVHQWFVELLRRFNLSFAIFDEERCTAIESGGVAEGEDPPEDFVAPNPFGDDQLILTSINLLAGDPKRAAQAAEAGWDLLIVDEAHHLGWEPEGASDEYTVVETLAKTTPALLLLTGTPGQLRPEGHFARLRLLDPDRFSDLPAFLKEQAEATAVSAIAGKIEQEEKLDKAETTALSKWLGGSVPEDSKETLAKLLDLHGTGRVMFRNRRANLGGFPERAVHLVPLVAEAADGDVDPRLAWLIETLTELGNEKVLVICRTKEMVEELQQAIDAQVRIKSGLFHEGLELIARDRNAAYFAETDGARLLICSEIGSEGRNFQFAHHLVLYDLPLTPSLLEQRIGRLDRIGQKETVQIHVPFVEDTDHAALARWFHEGLNAFEKPLEGGAKLLKEFATPMAVARPSDKKAWDAIIADTQKAKAALDAELEAGRDRLLELSSFNAEAADEVVKSVAAVDTDPGLENILVDIFDQIGVAVEDLGNGSYYVRADSVFSGEVFPGMRDAGMSITFDRATAAVNEPFGFITWDSPIVGTALEMLLNGEQGSSAFGQLPGTAAESGVLIECVFLLEPIAPGGLGCDRFLPPTPIVAFVDHTGNDITKTHQPGKVKDGDRNWLKAKLEVLQRMVPGMVENAEKFASPKAKRLRTKAAKEMEAFKEAELDRLERLKTLGHPIRPEEIAAAEKERDDLREALAKSRLRLDAIRLVVVGG